MTNRARIFCVVLSLVSGWYPQSVATQTIKTSSSNRLPARLVLVQKQTQDDDEENLKCKILGTSVPWNPPGTMDVSIDGDDIGSFDFGPDGSESLSFSCTRGNHTFRFQIEGTRVSCSGGLRIGRGLRFLPAMRVAPNGYSVCSLTPQ